MKLPILCMSCNVHILDLDTPILAWPLRFEMFAFTAANWTWPAPGPMHTDIYCPICLGFPMHWDAGTGEVGKWLKVMDGNGKPKMVSVEQLLKNRPLPPQPVFQPCPQCGAKPGRGGKILMHRRGCPTKDVVVKATVPPSEPVEEAPQPDTSIIGQVMDKVRQEVEARVSKNGKEPAGSEPVTKAEIAELERDRLHRGRPAAQLRAIND